MPVADDLIEILVCPETKQPLTRAAEDLLSDLNAKVASGTLRTRGGSPVPAPITEGLVREDGKILYVVDDSIPVMLIEESIEL